MTRQSWHLDRRTFLRGGGGVALALPFLNAMEWAAPAAALPRRMVVCYIAYGAYMPKAAKGQQHHPWNWWPCPEPGPLTFNESSQPFAPLKEHVSYLRGLDHAGGHALGGHSSGDVFATGAAMADAEKTNNISIDQVAARALGHETRYGSLVLGTEGGTGSYGSCKTLSHHGPGRPIPSMHKPREIFERLFRPYAGQDVADVRARLKRESSILDLLLENARGLDRRLGREDRTKMAEYLESVRSLEKRVERTDRWTHEPLPAVDAGKLALDVGHQDPVEYTRCLYDLIFHALRTDSTRYISYMLESELSTENAVGKFATRALGYEGQTHDLAHKRPIESGHWDRWRAEQHAYFLKRLRDTREGDGSLLDRTVVLWGSAHPHASHNTRDYPIHLAGGHALGFRHGKLHGFEGTRKVPLANLFVSMLHGVGVPVEKFADSTGPMPELRPA